MKENWTKGEWFIEYDNCDHGHGQWYKAGPAKVEVSYNISTEEELEWKANVQLIAAAPKLYEALKMLKERAENGEYVEHALDVAEQALASARGEDDSKAD